MAKRVTHGLSVAGIASAGLIVLAAAISYVLLGFASDTVA